MSKVDILPAIDPDHSMPILDIDFAKFQRGKGFFKFNNSLIKDKDYVKIVTKAIRDVTMQSLIYNLRLLRSYKR